MSKGNLNRVEQPGADETDAKWLLLGTKVMDELRVLARLARPAEKR